MKTKQILNHIPQIKFADSDQFFLLAGPCVIESEKQAFRIAEKIITITDKYKIPFIFKGSYRKANRSRLDSFTGIGDQMALDILKKIRQELNVPTVTDIHSAEEAKMAADYVDILQIPAFLCRQTDILVAAAKTGKVVNIKKGQFMSAYQMLLSAKKVESVGNTKIILTERGTFMGYGDLVVDFRNIFEMKKFSYPVVFDATHSVQRLGVNSNVSGGNREYVQYMALAAKSFGANAYFLEVHPNPDEALSDGPNTLHLSDLDTLIEKIMKR